MSIAQPKATRLSQIVNVAADTPNDGDSLVFDAASGQWIASNVTPGDGDITTSMLADDSVTDQKESNRTIVDTTTPTGDTGKPGTLFSWIANMIKQITGGATWRTAPTISLSTLTTHASRHASGGADALIGSTVSIPTGNTGSTAGTNTTTASRVDHHHGTPPVVTTSVNGLMSSTDKSKLDGISAGAGPPTPLATTTPSAEAVGSTGAVGTGTSAARNDHIHSMPGLATTSVDGFMDSSDKSKLNGIASGATNTPFATVTPSNPGTANVGTTASGAARGDHTHNLPPLATTSANGLMSSTDKTKLNGLGGSPPLYQDGIGSAFTIPTSSAYADITGLTFTPTDAGTYIVSVIVDINNFTGSGFYGAQLMQGGFLQWGPVIIPTGATGMHNTIAFTYIGFLASGSAVTVQVAQSASLSAGSTVSPTATLLAAVFLG